MNREPRRELRGNPRAFTLIEMLVTIAIIAVLAAILMPSLGRAREASKTLACLTHLRELARGWQIYADENGGTLVPGRMYEQPGGITSPANHYDVGNGLKYRPHWPATMGAQVGLFAFNQPSTLEDRQDYDSNVYKCPTVPKWIDERNFGYGYNHQFLGNGRQTGERFHNFPVLQSQIKATSGTVVVADSMGTAAGVPASERRGYTNDGPDHFANLGNHGWSLDPPRLTDESDRGTGDVASPRTAVDPRHRGKANVVFADAHGEIKTPHELGYRITASGCYANAPDGDCPDAGAGNDAGDVGRRPRSLPLDHGGEHGEDEDEDLATNRLFSGSGRDVDPPPLPAIP